VNIKLTACFKRLASRGLSAEMTSADWWMAATGENERYGHSPIERDECRVLAAHALERFEAEHGRSAPAPAAPMAAKKDPERQKLEDAARALDCDEDNLRDWSDDQLREFIRKHVLSDGAGGDPERDDDEPESASQLHDASAASVDLADAFQQRLGISPTGRALTAKERRAGELRACQAAPQIDASALLRRMGAR
jgi:hypothetical protein